MLSSQLNFIGARKDREITVVQFIMPGEYPGVTYDLEAFVNLNASLHYQYSENWSFELKAENLTNNQYQMWYNYPDLGATITLGAQYRFDL
jgi:outer membrane cobalamin receptor